MGLGSRSSSGAPNIPPPADYIANENIRQENMSNYEPEAKRQRRVELIREVRQFGGAIVRGPVPLHIKQEAEELAKIFEIDGVALYSCMHALLTSTPELQEECDKRCHKDYTSFYHRNEMQLCHKWSITDQNKNGFWGSSYDECGKRVSNRNHDIALCCKRCHIIIDSQLRGDDAHEVVQ
jgi:hypothetical protein